MSFILDALKQLEDKRRSESAPDLSTVHIEGNSNQSKRPILLYLLVAALILNVVILAVWLRPQQNETNSFTKETIKKPAPAAQKSDEEIVENAAPVKQEIAETSAAPDITVTETREIPAIETSSLPINPSPEEITALKSRMAEEQLLVTTSPSLEPTPDEELTNAEERTLLDINQLPLDIRKALPDLTVTGHIYSNSPGSRVVNINGDVIREGETVITGLTINEITMSGVIFDFEGMLFSVRAF